MEHFTSSKSTNYVPRVFSLGYKVGSTNRQTEHKIHNGVYHYIKRNIHKIPIILSYDLVNVGYMLEYKSFQEMIFLANGVVRLSDSVTVFPEDHVAVRHGEFQYMAPSVDARIKGQLNMDSSMKFMYDMYKRKGIDRVVYEGKIFDIEAISAIALTNVINLRFAALVNTYDYFGQFAGSSILTDLSAIDGKYVRLDRIAFGWIDFSKYLNRYTEQRRSEDSDKENQVQTDIKVVGEHVNHNAENNDNSEPIKKIKVSSYYGSMGGKDLTPDFVKESMKDCESKFSHPENNIKVELINPEETKRVIHNHGVFACTCYGTDESHADKVGKNCLNTNHTSGSRCEYIKFRISGIDRGTAEQIMRHEIGVRYDNIDKDPEVYIESVYDENPCNIVKNMQSFRYTDPTNFGYYIPKSIRTNEAACKIYEDTMKMIDTSRNIIKSVLEESGCDEHKAIEDANYVLPRATTITLTIGFTIEALIHFMHKRLCVRAQEGIREVAGAMRKEVNKVSSDLAAHLLPQCAHLLWCPEGKKSCGLYPSRDKVKEIVNNLGKE